MLAQAVSQANLQQARAHARQTTTVQPSSSSDGETTPQSGRTRRLPPRPDWMGSPERASTENLAAMAEMRQLRSMKPTS